MYASKTRKEKFSGPDENCQRNLTDFAGSLVTSSRPPGRLQKKRDESTTEHRIPVSRYEHVMAAGGPQMLPTDHSDTI